MLPQVNTKKTRIENDPCFKDFFDKVSILAITSKPDFLISMTDSRKNIIMFSR